MALFTRLVKVGITDSSESKAEKKSDTLGKKKMFDRPSYSEKCVVTKGITGLFKV